MNASRDIGKKDVIRALTDCGLRPGQVVFVHSDGNVAAQFRSMSAGAAVDMVLDSMLEILGPDGTLIMPTFTYSLTKSEVYDVRSTPSTVGLLSDRFWRRPGVLRSDDPIFSIAVRGPRGEDYIAAPFDRCFSDESPLGLLRRDKARIFLLGCRFDAMTFVHHVEFARRVPYRYDKVFEGRRIDREGRELPVRIVYFVRDLSRRTEVDLRLLKARMEKAGQLRKAALGRVGFVSAAAPDVFDTASHMLDEDSSSLIAEGMAA